MGQLVLLVVAAAWAAVLVPPLLRSRIENRPNSSVTDFRNQLSSLQKTVPGRGVSMRTMARPLAPSPLSRPAAPGRPVMRSGVKTHDGKTVRSAAQSAPRHHEPLHQPDLSPRRRTHADRPHAERPRTPARNAIATREAMRRRRANVLFVLGLISACTLFLAATTKTEALYYVFGGTFSILCIYVYVLGQHRQRELAAVPVVPVETVVPRARPTRIEERRQRHAPPPVRHRRSSVPAMERHHRRYSHAV
jgi:hypothetical protein